jgi:AraC-like DNA-binding protein
MPPREPPSEVRSPADDASFSGASVCIKAIRICVVTAAALGLPPERSLAVLGVSPEMLADPAARVPHELAMRAWTDLPERLGSATFGLRAAELSVSASFDIMDHAMAHCTTVREALEVLMRFQRLLHEANDLRLEPAAPGEVRLSQRLRMPGAVAPHMTDFIASQWVVRSRKLTGAAPKVARLELTRPMPDDVSEHRRIFDAPIAFGAPRNAIWFDAAYLEQPIERADPSLSPVLRRHAEDLLAALPASNSLATALHKHLLRTLDSGLPSIADAASALGVSTRSLQRKLEEEGTSFKGVLDDVRRALAESYLRDGTRTVSEVAFLVGFSEVSAFSRAFRRWTGKSAVSYRRAGS